jgi:type III secretion protein D
MSREILLGIFTGVHAGAEILLGEGEHSLGTAEDNDIILTDSTLAPKHCLIILPDRGDLRLRPLEGELVSDNAGQNAELALPPSTPLLAGKVCLAWTPKGVKWGPMRMPSLVAAPDRVDGNNVGDKAQNEAKGESDGKAETAAGNGSPKAGSAPAEAPETGKHHAPASKARFKRILASAFAVILLLGLFISIKPSSDSNTLEALGADLKNAGFSSLLLGERNGIAVVSGLVDSEDKIDQVRGIAGKRPYQVQLVVWTKESYIMLARSILAAHGLFPAITLEGGGILLRGYAQDRLVERAALVWLKNGLPGIVPLKSDFITKAETAPVLRQELDNAALAGKIDVVWGPGLVELGFSHGLPEAGAGARENNGRLQTVIAAVRGRLGYPVAFQVWSDLEGQQIHLDEEPVAETGGVSPPAEGMGVRPGPEAQSRNPFGDSISLRSVAQLPDSKASGEALPFITTSDGRLYFTGGRLPSGYTLTGIFRDRLEFTKNNANLVYKLRGN